MAPTLAKFLPDDTEERYMSRRPALICWRMGRSVKGTAVPGRVAVAEPADTEGSVVAETEFRLLVATVEGLTPAVAAAPVAAVVGLVVGVLTGRGPDIGVSYRIFTLLAFSSKCVSSISVLRP